MCHVSPAAGARRHDPLSKAARTFQTAQGPDAEPARRRRAPRLACAVLLRAQLVLHCHAPRGEVVGTKQTQGDLRGLLGLEREVHGAVLGHPDRPRPEGRRADERRAMAVRGGLPALRKDQMVLVMECATPARARPTPRRPVFGHGRRCETRPGVSRGAPAAGPSQGRDELRGQTIHAQGPRGVAGPLREYKPGMGQPTHLRCLTNRGCDCD